MTGQLFTIYYDGRAFQLNEREMNAFAESYGPEVEAGYMDADDATYLFLLNLGKIAPVDSVGNANARGAGAVT